MKDTNLPSVQQLHVISQLLEYIENENITFPTSLVESYILMRGENFSVMKNQALSLYDAFIHTYCWDNYEIAEEIEFKINHILNRLCNVQFEKYTLAEATAKVAEDLIMGQIIHIEFPERLIRASLAYLTDLQDKKSRLSIAHSIVNGIQGILNRQESIQFATQLGNFVLYGFRLIAEKETISEEVLEYLLSIDE